MVTALHNFDFFAGIHVESMARQFTLQALAQGHFRYQSVEIFKKKSLGVGSYGTVYKAKCDELPCAAKILHPTLFETNDPSSLKIIQRFDQECNFLSGIRHPHIVQYLGMTRDPETGLPVLLMELMDESLTRFLERSKDPLPFHLQVNLCHDIALALAYLHSNGIIHRDLSSNNVLLIAGSRAKVTDFGMSKLADANRHATPSTLCPGTEVYMSPEALRDPPVYTMKLDCFSFGVLTIQIITRQFPAPQPALKLVEDPRYPLGRIQVLVPETERRKSHLILIEVTHPLHSLAINCLNYNERDRPSAQELCSYLDALKQASSYSESLQQSQDRAQSRIANREVEYLQVQMEQKSKQIELLCHQLEASELITVQFQDNLAQKDKTIADLQERLSASRERQMRQLQQTSKEETVTTTNKLTLKWRKSRGAPQAMTRGSATADERAVYFNSTESVSVYAYYADTGKWSTFLDCPKVNFSLAAVKGHVTAVGGEQFHQPTNTLLSLSGEGKNMKWLELYPPMPTKRLFCAVVSCQEALIVAGGQGGAGNILNTVEIMDSKTEQWSIASCLPYPLSNATISSCGLHLYILGGNDRDGKTTSVLTCSLTSLLESCNLEPQVKKRLSLANSDSSKVWQTLANLPVYYSTSAAVNRQLLAIGGEDTDSIKTTAVYAYNFSGDCWDVNSCTAISRSHCLVVVLPQGNGVMIVGGDTHAVEIATIA